MMILKCQRFVPAIILALILHVGLFLTHLTKNSAITLPKPLAVKRIAVSLGSRTIKTPPEQEPVREQIVEEPEAVEVQEKVTEEAHLPEALPEKASPKNVPIIKSQPAEVVTPPQKTEVKQIHRILTARKVKTLQPPQKTTEVISPPPLPETDTGEENVPVEPAARIVQEATPMYQLNPPPEYPRLARRRGYHGVVLLEAHIDEYGRVTDVQVFKTSGYGILDQAALKAVLSWKFTPGTAAGLPSEMWVKVPVRFRLN